MKIMNLHDRALCIAASGVTVEPGESAEVDDALGASLAEQVDRWGAAPKAKPPTKPKAPAAESEEDTDR